MNRIIIRQTSSLSVYPSPSSPKKQLEAMLQLIRKEDQNEGANTEYAGAITTTPKTPTFAAGWIFCPCDVCVRHSKDTWHDLWD